MYRGLALRRRRSHQATEHGHPRARDPHGGSIDLGRHRIPEKHSIQPVSRLTSLHLRRDQKRPALLVGHGVPPKVVADPVTDPRITVELATNRRPRPRYVSAYLT